MSPAEHHRFKIPQSFELNNTKELQENEKLNSFEYVFCTSSKATQKLRNYLIVFKLENEIKKCVCKNQFFR